MFDAQGAEINKVIKFGAPLYEFERTITIDVLYIT